VLRGAGSGAAVLRGLRLAVVQGLLLACAACAWQEWAVTTSDETVGSERDQTGVTFCPNGVEYRNQYGYGNGISDVEISPSGLRLIIRYRWHTFVGPSTKIRERVEITIP